MRPWPAPRPVSGGALMPAGLRRLPPHGLLAQNRDVEGV